MICNYTDNKTLPSNQVYECLNHSRTGKYGVRAVKRSQEQRQSTGYKLSMTSLQANHRKRLSQT